MITVDYSRDICCSTASYHRNGGFNYWSHDDYTQPFSSDGRCQRRVHLLLWYSCMYKVSWNSGGFWNLFLTGCVVLGLKPLSMSEDFSTSKMADFTVHVSLELCSERDYVITHSVCSMYRMTLKDVGSKGHLGVNDLWFLLKFLFKYVKLRIKKKKKRKEKADPYFPIFWVVRKGQTNIFF